MNKIIESLFNRKSMRVFTEEKITTEDRQLIIDSAIQAPTAGNLCLYSVIEVVAQEAKEKLALYCDNQPFIATAPLVLVFLADYQKYYDSYQVVIGKNVDSPKLGDLMLAASDACIAAQNSVVAAEALGIGSCYIGDIMENHDQVAELLALPDYTFPACMLVYGHPTEQQKQRIKPARFKAEDLVYQDKYQRKDETAIAAMYKNQNPQTDYKTTLERLYKFKYDCDFRQEMNDSVAKYLKKWR